MALQGAVFDCDGTILDSMPMWTHTCVHLLERYGVPDAQSVFEEHESLDMDKKCYWYHENLGIGSSGEALYRELWDMVAEAYTREVRPYPGCKEFLDELAHAGIPCVIVSSTPTQMLRHALKQHGLLSYFEELIFVGDVGRSKAHPDCYIAAWQRLGTAREDTWVFEDAPFGVRSAVRAGFPTVAILNDHDGRDEGFLRTWATVVARSYEGLCVKEFASLEPRITDALIVAGSPQASSAELVKLLASRSSLVIAADKGIDVLHEARIVPDIFCGDEDSASPAALAWATSEGVPLERHPVEKDDTDLGLAIAHARAVAEERGSALRLTVTCASGGRPDHALGVYGILARHADTCARLVEDGFECRILSPVGDPFWELRGREGTTVSVLALAPHTTVSESGMRWNLDHTELGILDDLGVSNLVIADHATIACHSGVLAAFMLA